MANGEILVDFRLTSTLTMQTVTGGDLATFADELVANYKTSVDKYREDLNQSIMMRLGKKKINRSFLLNCWLQV